MCNDSCIALDNSIISMLPQQHGFLFHAQNAMCKETNSKWLTV